MLFIANKQYANIHELEADAKQLLTENVWGYYNSGAESETAMADNLNAFTGYRLLPRCLVDVSTIDTACRLFGTTPLSMPVLIAPMAMQRLCHPDGEIAMAKAAASCGTVMALSTMATASLEEVAAAVHDGFNKQVKQQSSGQTLWYQIYVLTRRDVTAALIRDAERLGYKALVITVDAPRLGRREADERNKFTLPPGLSLKMLERITATAGQTGNEPADGSKFGKHFSRLIDDSLTWEFLQWIRTVTRLPVLVKGILAPDDARKAVELGADGIIVSNHGGRQLDYAPAGIDVLPRIADAVQGRVPIIVDGGIRRGTDVLKCLGLGASAVMIGRPMLWALTLGGQRGVEAALGQLREEIELGMALLGCRSLQELSEFDYVIHIGERLQLPRSRL